MMRNQTLSLSAAKAIEDCLSDIPFMKVIEKETSLNDAGPDYILHLETPFGRKAIYVEISASGQPRFARVLIEKVSLLTEEPKIYRIFVAPFISERTGTMLRNAGIGFVDLAGAMLMLIFPVVFMSVLNWKLTLFTLSLTPAVLIATSVFRIKVREINIQIRRIIAELNTLMQESLSGNHISSWSQNII